MTLIRLYNTSPYFRIERVETFKEKLLSSLPDLGSPAGLGVWYRSDYGMAWP